MKNRYRFGLPYFQTRPLWIRPIKSEGVIMGSRLVIRDTHQEWDVKDLWTRYVKPKETINEQSPEPTPTSETQDGQGDQQVDA